VYGCRTCYMGEWALAEHSVVRAVGVPEGGAIATAARIARLGSEAPVGRGKGGQWFQGRRICRINRLWAS
jgi:hypothetical protein